MPAIPAIVVWTLGAIAAVAAIKLLGREWRRVNAELDRMRPFRMADPERSAMPVLKRDPSTGEYRPDRS